MIDFDKEKNPLMIKFDVGSKEFRSLPELEVASGHDFIVVNLKECLSVLAYKVESSNSLVDVHYFDEKHGVWSKMYNIVGPICLVRCLVVLSMGVRLCSLRTEYLEVMIPEQMKSGILTARRGEVTRKA